MLSGVVNYTEILTQTKYYGDVILIAAHGRGNNFLALYKQLLGVDSIGRRRYSYVLDYRWLSCNCENIKDEAYTCVMGSEIGKYTKKELLYIDSNILTGEVNLFNCFNLF